MTSVSEDIIRVLTQDGGWMKRSDIIHAVYGNTIEVNAHHRALLISLTANGKIEQREQSYKHNFWFEYRVRV